MIFFEALRWRNFLSTGNAWTEVQLNKAGTTLIIGKNGSGKTTFGDALSFVLFNKAFRDVKKDELVNSINGKECAVEAVFKIGSHQWEVRRGIKPNFFEVRKDGVLIKDEDRSAVDHQAWFEQNVLRFNHKAFSQVVFLAAASFVPFMKLKTYDRRKVVEDLLDIQVFSVMNRLLKERVSENQKEVAELDLKSSMTRDKITMQENFEKVIQEDVESRMADIDAKIEKLKAEKREKAMTGVVRCGEEQDLPYDLVWADARTRYDKHSADVSKYRTLIEAVQKRIKFFCNNDKCPTCEQAITEAHSESIVVTEVEEEEELKDHHAESIAQREVARKHVDAKAEYDKIMSEIKLDLKLLADGMKLIDKQVAQLEAEKEQVKRKSERVVANPGESSEELRAELGLIESARKDAYADRSSLAATANLLKDDGIKAGIVKQYVPKINQMINKYLAELDFYVNFELDENFSETIKSRHRDKFTYESFSEGEKFRINIAILFAWRSIARARNSVATNILIMDEVMDSSLDESGADEFIKVLKQLVDGTSTFIISHRGNQLVDKFDRVLAAQKVKNFSSMEEV